MWLGPALFIVTSVFLWRYVGAVFVPELLARPVLRLLPALEDMRSVIVINAAIVYFGAYFLFAVLWGRIRVYLRNPFIGGFVLWLGNVLLLFPLLGRGILGYQMPQGWVAVSFPLFVAHWIYARGLQFQASRL